MNQAIALHVLRVTMTTIQLLVSIVVRIEAQWLEAADAELMTCG